MSFIQTFTGLKVFPLDPTPNSIDILDIAHALSNVCRFTGHTSRFYSVGQHSLWVSDHVPRRYALEGLLHDASEAYLCDVSSPVKADPRFAFYREAEAHLMQVIYQGLGLVREESDEVHRADVLALVTEARDFGFDVRDWGTPYDCLAPDPEPIVAFHPAVVEQLFLQRFSELVKGEQEAVFEEVG